jgi:hypothetical protein
MDFQTMVSATSSAAGNGAASGSGDDPELLALETQFKALTAQLAILQSVSNAQTATSCSDDQTSVAETLRPRIRERSDHDATRQAEAILARLYPVEQAIMTTPARTIAGLGVKARHAAYVMSQYWAPPITEIDWHAKVVRLLIESVCSLANVRLPFSDPDEPTEPARENPGSPSSSSR